MSDTQSEWNTAEIEAALRECGNELDFPPTPNSVATLWRRLVGPTGASLTPPSSSDPPRPSAFVPPATSTSLPWRRIQQGYWLRESLKLVAALLVFAAVAALLIAVLHGRGDAPLTQLDTPPDGASMLLLADAQPGTPSSGLRLRPVDPLTLLDVPGLQPIDLGHHYLDAFSPDGQRLALVTWPGDTNAGGMLRVFDLASWTEIGPGAAVDAVSNPLFASDDHTVYLVDASNLYGYDPQTGALRTIVSLPPDLTPNQMRLSTDGAHMALYCLPTGDVVTEAPHLVLVDLDAGSIAADVTLEGVKAWQHDEREVDENEYPYRIYMPALAWDMAHERLYVVHAAEDRVTVVDLARGVIVEDAEFRPRASLLRRFIGWLAPSVAASDVPWTRRQAALSADGSRLYVAGTRDEWTKQPGTNWNQGWQENTVSLGFQVIDTRDMSVVAQPQLPLVAALLLMPDNGDLLAHTYTLTPSNDAARSTAQQRLSLLDGRSLAERGHLDVNGPFTIEAVSPDGRRAYLQHQMLTGDVQQTQLLVVDLSSWRVIGTRALDGAASFGELLTPPTRSQR